MKTYFEKNETQMCKCCETKKTTEIFCQWCKNFWQATVSPMPFDNTNESVDSLNEMLNQSYNIGV